MASLGAGIPAPLARSHTIVICKENNIKPPATRSTSQKYQSIVTQKIQQKFLHIGKWSRTPMFYTTNEEHTVLKNKIIVAFHIYSNFDNHCILSHSIFLGLNFEAFYFFGFKFRVILFFGWLKFVLGRASLSKKCLCAPLGFVHINWPKSEIFSIN